MILVKKFNEQKVIDSPKNNKLFDVEGIKFITPELKYKSKTPNKELPQRQLKSVKSVSKLPSIE